MNSPDQVPSTPWPYPRWIAHRGAGKLAPENTLAAFRLGASHGFRMFECDVKLSADGEPFLLHDADLGRTTSGHGAAAAQRWDELSRLDAGSWHSSIFAGEPLLRLETLARWLQANQLMVNLEIKPSPGQDEQTGEVVARWVHRLWAGQAVWPLLSSFSMDALRAARDAAPDLPRALLLEELRPGWLDAALGLACVAVVGHHPHLNAENIAQAHAVGLKVLTYTVNDAERVRVLWAAGLDGLITDAVDKLAPDRP
ncbi:glycerophosphodiester phosphodiesterase [Aquabacterium sp.]|uniref:glycerophosphodiester phosphodiesterase n=1 Tax=Aquabacterium sp. TaxID=1872578 RepID=UPI00248992AC|nr:glycerophosphodiester phosphodiesterase [Aquabacterium sp.]MDI1258452.1 glycerophosphodiester phosphodiesterase [Aquabacterium sp.]